MANNLKDHPLASYHDVIADITSNFTFNHHPVPDTEGLISSPQGFGQLAYHRPTNSVVVLFSKVPGNLAGRKLDDGRRVADAEQMAGCYIFGARRLRNNDDDTPLSERREFRRVFRNLREDMDIARRKLGERSRKHLTLYNADNLYTNGRHVYEILPRKDGKFDVLFRMATYRKDGSFIPFDMNDNTLHGKFSRATKRIETTDTMEDARKVVGEHWKNLSSDLWSHRNIFMSEGKSIIAQKIASDLVDFGTKHGKRFIGSTLLVGGGFGAYSLFKHGSMAGAYAVVGTAFAGALIHTLVHSSVEMGLSATFKRWAKSSKDQTKDITAYEFDSDVSEYFKKPEDLEKVCPHIDMTRFKVEDFELLSLEQLSLKKDREMEDKDNIQPTSLAGHLLFMGQRGFSSQAYILDERTELKLFQSGITRLMHERKDGTIVVHAQYRPEMRVEGRELGQCHIDQFEGKIVRLEYNRKAPTFAEGCTGVKTISYDEMIAEVQTELLFSRQQAISQQVWEQSRESIETAFYDPEKSIFEKMKHAKIAASPHLSAILPEYALAA